MWLATTAVVVVAVAVQVSPGWGQACLTTLVGLVVGGATIVRLRRRHAARTVGWQLICLGVLLNSTGAVVYQVCESVLHVATWPTVAEIPFLALYPFLAAGMIVILRQEHHEKGSGSALDAATVSVGLALLCWILLIRPLAEEPDVSLLGRLVTYAYPIGDFALLAILVRLLVTGQRNAAVLSLGAGIVCFLIGDITWSMITQTGFQVTSASSAALTAVPLVGYLLCCWAGLHPSVAAVRTSPRPAGEPPTSNVLLGAWTLALLVAPTALLVEAALGGVQDAVAIGACAACLALLVSFRIRQFVQIMQGQSDRLRELSHSDPLTGLLNRRGLHGILPALMDESRRHGRPLSVLMIDIDFFKLFNDSYGHLMGDQLLAAASAAWSGAVRPGDRVARLGGEEFLVLLPDSQVPAVLEVDARLRLLVPLGQTYSAGIAQWRDGEQVDQLFARADAAMYLAKQRGRARTVVADADADAVPGSTAGRR